MVEAPRWSEQAAEPVSVVEAPGGWGGGGLRAGAASTRAAVSEAARGNVTKLCLH